MTKLAILARSCVTASAALLLCSTTVYGRYKETNAEALVMCPGVSPPKTLTPVDFARAQLVSLSWAKTAASTDEIEKAGKADNWVTFLTAVMRSTKTSTNSFICAKRSVIPFALDAKDKDTTTAAQLLVLVYFKHIDVNQRALELLKKMDTLKPAELSDQLSTLQVERGQLWAELVNPTAIGLMKLIDVSRIENERLPYLTVTKAQKQDFLDLIAVRFPEFRDGTPRDKWTDPAKTANLYIQALNERKCADEK